ESRVGDYFEGPDSQMNYFQVSVWMKCYGYK
ncbi:hypothetical protein AC249_AIPGENE9833, partial [Exaiptasia diaphana]